MPLCCLYFYDRNSSSAQVNHGHRQKSSLHPQTICLLNCFSQSNQSIFARLSYKSEELCVWSDCWELVWASLIDFSEGRAFPVLSFHFLAVLLGSLIFFLEVKTNYGKEMLHSLSSEQSLAFVFICRAGWWAIAMVQHQRTWIRLALARAGCGISIVSKHTAIGLSWNPKAPGSNTPSS